MYDEVARAALVAALDLFEFDAVHIHNLIGHSLAPLDALRDFPGPVSCSVHDLYLACPNFSLLYKKSVACGIPDDRSTCARCLAHIKEFPMPGSPPMPTDSVDYLDEFRKIVDDRLDAVDHWVFASQSAADYFLRVYEPGPDRVQIIEHGSVIRLGRRPAKPDERLLRDEPLRVAFVGLGWSKKGLDAVNELAEAFRDSTVEIHHFGNLMQPASPELRTHGAYDNELLPDLLHRAGIQVVLLPGPYAETFGIVMSEAAGRGHPGDRRELRRAGRTHPGARGRMDDRSHRSRRHPVGDRAPRPGATSSCASHVRVLRIPMRTVAGHRGATGLRRAAPNEAGPNEAGLRSPAPSGTGSRPAVRV